MCHIGWLRFTLAMGSKFEQKLLSNQGFERKMPKSLITKNHTIDVRKNPTGPLQAGSQRALLPPVATTKLREIQGQFSV